MRFKEFYEADDLSFWVGNVHVTVKEVPLAHHERIMLEDADPKLLNVIKSSLMMFADKAVELFRSQPKPERAVPPPAPAPEVDFIKPDTAIPKQNLKKYKVSLRYPKTASGAKLGHYLPDVLYVFAQNPKEAQNNAEQFIRTKLEPVENDEPRRFRKNYLAGVERQHLDMKSSRVKTWTDFTTMLGDLGRKRGTYLLDYFDEPDLQMILKRAKSRFWEKDLAKLDPVQQRMLKKVYFTLAQDPYLSPGTKAMLDDEVTSTMRKLGRSIKPAPDLTQRQPGDDADEPDWPYWSVFEPKTDDEERAITNNMYSVRSVFDAAAKFGIPAKHVRDLAMRDLGLESPIIKEKRRLFFDTMGLLRKMIARKTNRWYDNGKIVKFLRKVANDGGDYDSKAMHDIGIEWDTISNDLFTQSEYDAEAYPFRDNGDPNSTKLSSDAAQWLWDFLQRGKPEKRPAWQYYRDALENILQDREVKKKPRPDDGNVPF